MQVSARSDESGVAHAVGTADGPRGEHLAEGPVPAANVIRVGAAAASLAAAAVHASAIPEHSFHILHAVAFIAMAGFQAGWAYAVLRSLSARVLIAGAGGHGAILMLWLWSRTAGLPDFVPGSHGVEALEVKDLMASLLAVGALVCIDLLSRRDLRSRLITASRAGAVLGAAVVLAACLGLAGVISQGHVHGDDHVHDPARTQVPADMHVHD